MCAFLLCVKMPAEHCSALKYASQMCQQEHYATFVEASVDLSLCPGDKKKYKDGKKKSSLPSGIWFIQISRCLQQYRAHV